MGSRQLVTVSVYQCSTFSNFVERGIEIVVSLRLDWRFVMGA